MYSCKAEEELITELKERYNYKGIDDIFSGKKNLEPEEVNLIIKFLPKVYEQRLGAGVILVQSLKWARETFDPSVLVKLFEESELNSSVKAGIGYALIDSKTGDISGWIKERLLSDQASFENSALIAGLLQRAGFKNETEVKDFLEVIFNKYPIAVLELYNKIGDKSDIDFLLEQINKTDKSLGKEIEKTLKKILRREGVDKLKK